MLRIRPCNEIFTVFYRHRSYTSTDSANVIFRYGDVDVGRIHKDAELGVKLGASSMRDKNVFLRV